MERACGAHRRGGQALVRAPCDLSGYSPRRSRAVGRSEPSQAGAAMRWTRRATRATDDWRRRALASAPARPKRRSPPHVSTRSRAASRSARIARRALGEHERSCGCSRRAAMSSAHVVAAADRLRRERVGDTRHLRRQSQHQLHQRLLLSLQLLRVLQGHGTAQNLRGPAYDLDLDEIARRVTEAWARGATEVCMQGGIHPRYTGDTYLDILRGREAGRARDARACLLAARNLAGRHDAGHRRCRDYLARLRDAGSARCRARRRKSSTTRCAPSSVPDKLTTAQWLEVMETAHRVGLRTTATIMFGHVERPVHWARHLLRIRAAAGSGPAASPNSCRCRSSPMEAPIYLKGARAARGRPSARRC